MMPGEMGIVFSAVSVERIVQALGITPEEAREALRSLQAKVPFIEYNPVTDRATFRARVLGRDESGLRRFEPIKPA